MSRPTDLVQGTLDRRLLKIVALEPLKGWAISQRLRQVSGDVLQVSLLGGSEMPYAAPGKYSPVRGAVPADRCAHGLGLVEQIDQLGNPRPINTHCTIGAIEGVSDLIFADSFTEGYFGE